MKYIKDRFCNSRKTSPSFGAPAQDLFTREERTAFSCGLWVQRYDKFFKPPNFWRSFFRRSISIYRKSVLSRPLSQLCKRFDQPPSPPTSSYVSDTSDHPFFGVANAKVQQLFESTKFSEKFFFESIVRASSTYYIGVPRSHSRGYPLYIVPYPLRPETSTKRLTNSSLIVKTCSPLKDLQTPPKTRSFELRVQR